MGSTGSGNFTDYSGNRPSGGNKNGGSSGEDKCLKAFTALLEDVERCSYFQTNNDVPEVGEEVTISFEQRLVAINNDGLVIGILPTKYNYLLLCLENSISYYGRVVTSSNELLATVTIDVSPVN